MEHINVDTLRWILDTCIIPLIIMFVLLKLFNYGSIFILRFLGMFFPWAKHAYEDIARENSHIDLYCTDSDYHDSGKRATNFKKKLYLLGSWIKTDEKTYVDESTGFKKEDTVLRKYLVKSYDFEAKERANVYICESCIRKGYSEYTQAIKNELLSEHRSSQERHHENMAEFRDFPKQILPYVIGVTIILLAVRYLFSLETTISYFFVFMIALVVVVIGAAVNLLNAFSSFTTVLFSGLMSFIPVSFIELSVSENKIIDQVSSAIFWKSSAGGQYDDILNKNASRTYEEKTDLGLDR